MTSQEIQRKSTLHESSAWKIIMVDFPATFDYGRVWIQDDQGGNSAISITSSMEEKKLKQLALNFEGLTWTIEWKELDVRNPQKSEHWEFQEKEIKGHRNVVCLPFVETKSVKYVGQILCNKTHLNKEAIYSAGPTRTTMHSPGARIPIPATVNRAGKWFPVAYKHCGCTGLLEWVNTSIWDQWNCISCGHLLPLLYRHSTFPHSSRFSPSSYTTNDYPLVLKHDTEHVAHF